MRPPTVRLWDDRELIVDSFAGGGGASLGISWALGRGPDIAINHDADAISMHRANHPEARHYTEDVWKVDPREATQGRPVGLMWLSPDCKHFSKASGGKPVSPRVRGLAWVAVRWAKAVKPRIICLENVEEFQSYGPLGPDGRPCPDRKGVTFRRFVGRLRNLGYEVQWRELRACDYGAPTIRKRLFLIARADGQPIVWPNPTHGRTTGLPYRTAGECIDWTIPTPSIFARRKPLAANTCRRIAAGVYRYVLDTDTPYLVRRTEHGIEAPYITTYYGDKSEHGDGRGQSLHDPLATQSTANRFGLVAPYLVPRYGEREGQAPRARSVAQPMPAIVPTQNGGSLVTAFLAKHYTGVVGADLFNPLPTVTATDHNALVEVPLVQGVPHRGADVRAFLTAYYGAERDGTSLFDPLPTVVTKDRFALVTVAGQEYEIADIGMRMLAPRELFRGQGFPDSYQIEYGVDAAGRRVKLTKTAQVKMCGNSVSPYCAAAIVAANAGREALAGAA